MGDRSSEKRGRENGPTVVTSERKPLTREGLIDLLRGWLNDDETSDSLRKFAWEQLFALSAPDTSDEDAPFEMPSEEVRADPAALAAFTLTCLGRLHAGTKRKR